ncbi:hypothetical protein [Rosistilla oblonga]|uniref:hypothetical protein n=1 Tax=Rosistilla oblonga TaxID=2527990 RepID=UPI003A971714
MSESQESHASQLDKEPSQTKAPVEGATDEPNWIVKTAGAFRGDPVFAEVVKLGKEIRNAEQPELDS